MTTPKKPTEEERKFLEGVVVLSGIHAIARITSFSGDIGFETSIIQRAYAKVGELKKHLGEECLGEVNFVMLKKALDDIKKCL